MLKPVPVPITDIYVPAAQRKELDEAKIDLAAEDLMGDDDVSPIQVRKGKGRYVLVKGIHRLEAAKALGEETIDVLVVAARKH